jgi:hypothetical protein
MPFKLEAKVVVKNLVETVEGWRGHFASIGCPDSELKALAPSFTRYGEKICAV